MERYKGIAAVTGGSGMVGRKITHQLLQKGYEVRVLTRTLYRDISNNCPVDGVRPMPHLPLIVPHILRRPWRGAGNYGNIRYSSEKLLSAGFRYRIGVEGAVRRIAASQHPMIS